MPMCEFISACMWHAPKELRTPISVTPYLLYLAERDRWAFSLRPP